MTDENGARPHEWGCGSTLTGYCRRCGCWCHEATAYALLLTAMSRPSIPPGKPTDS